MEDKKPDVTETDEKTTDARMEMEGDKESKADDSGEDDGSEPSDQQEPEGLKGEPDQTDDTPKDPTKYVDIKMGQWNCPVCGEVNISTDTKHVEDRGNIGRIYVKCEFCSNTFDIASEA